MGPQESPDRSHSNQYEIDDSRNNDFDPDVSPAGVGFGHGEDRNSSIALD